MSVCFDILPDIDIILDNRHVKNDHDWWNIRAVLYMPTLSAIRYNGTLKIFYERIMEKRTIKKQGMVAVMRKLLIYIYTLWNNETVFVENYQK